MSAWFDRFRKFLERASGVALDADKLYFAESRLRSIAQARGFPSVEVLFSKLEISPDPVLQREIVEAMLTNETLFFRDRQPFEQFRTVILPRLMEARAAKRHIRIWCAACATGQEPYSLAMILDEEARKLTGWRVEIVGTDLSTAAIESARAGVYTQFEVQRGLPINLLLRYFQRQGDAWTVQEHLRARVQFRTFNLLSDYRALGQFDLIMCRNVLLYFDLPTRRGVLTRLAGALEPDGYMMLGAAESVVGVDNSFAPDAQHKSIYTKTRASQPGARPDLRVVATV